MSSTMMSILYLAWSVALSGSPVEPRPFTCDEDRYASDMARLKEDSGNLDSKECLRILPHRLRCLQQHNDSRRREEGGESASAKVATSMKEFEFGCKHHLSVEQKWELYEEVMRLDLGTTIRARLRDWIQEPSKELFTRGQQRLKEGNVDSEGCREMLIAQLRYLDLKESRMPTQSEASNVLVDFGEACREPLGLDPLLKVYEDAQHRSFSEPISASLGVRLEALRAEIDELNSPDIRPHPPIWNGENSSDPPQPQDSQQDSRDHIWWFRGVGIPLVVGGVATMLTGVGFLAHTNREIAPEIRDLANDAGINPEKDGKKIDYECSAAENRTDASRLRARCEKAFFFRQTVTGATFGIGLVVLVGGAVVLAVGEGRRGSTPNRKTKTRRTTGHRTHSRRGRIGFYSGLDPVILGARYRF